MDDAQSSPWPGDEALCRNRLLAAMGNEGRGALAPHLRAVELSRGQRLFEPGEDVGWMHFPCDGTMLSLIVVLPDGRTADTGLIGCEGAVGGLVSRGHRPAFARAVVQIPGAAWRVEVGHVEEAKERVAALGDALARYADCLLAQLLQTVACNGRHSLEQRMANWLLTMQDRQGAAELPLTQEYLGEMLGVSRTYVTRTAAAFQAQGLIGYARGRLRVLDRAGLRAVSCDCQDTVAAHYDRVLPGLRPESPI
ncbi:Crp/Fnr family transcriptional regulator [Rubellimicrobium roseum]|uniref:Crp/Fnr family transcriptional regulator n=1 Tax=Rubellimicrobium roseum TaxID=687525 RepID=A0A5C4NDQ6_9RHOB|nr:Crp/Fnr family transcriptional regulator [Rubellimicrobium roseum]TNC72020.1 Crp/Fnr family transcriptional regulator [Rubellimicrobium roseum]